MAESTASIVNGKLISSRVIDKVTSKIEKGVLTKVQAIIIHQTGSDSADSSLSSYSGGVNGAHFLIDKDGTIFQTARTNQKCWHVGNIKSRCSELKTCSPEDLKEINSILFRKGESYELRVRNLSQHEAKKSYPERYPTNDDTLGIELVGRFDAKSSNYDTVTRAQNESLIWLVSTLESGLGLTNDDVYRHPQVSYKQSSEAESANWR
jgi:N-acetyl-anhydromuramyl-L-alanine amidase AmpD